MTFIDTIKFLNNIRDIQESLTNNKENDKDLLKLIQAVVSMRN